MHNKLSRVLWLLEEVSAAGSISAAVNREGRTATYIAASQHIAATVLRYPRAITAITDVVDGHVFNALHNEVHREANNE
jgi:hypothetical protein